MTKFDSVKKEIVEYLTLNGVESKSEQARILTECLQMGFNILKYGTSPQDNAQRENEGVSVPARKKKETKANTTVVKEDKKEEKTTKVSRRQIKIQKND